MRSDSGILRQVKQRLLVLVVGLVVTFGPALLVVTLWMEHLYRALFAILWIVCLASVVFGLWLISLGRLKAVSFMKRILPRSFAAIAGLVVLSLSGLFLPGYGLLWSPLPWEPREFHLAQQRLFWVFGPAIYGLGLWLLDLVRLKSLRLTDKRLMIPIVVLIVLFTIAVLTNNHLYMRLDHGQGG